MPPVLPANTTRPPQSPLLDICERLRTDLLHFVGVRASSGPPVFAPALLFLEDPREGVLRPATRVTWDDLRLGPLLENVLSGCLTRLSGLKWGLSDNQTVAAKEAAKLYAVQHAAHTKNPPAPLSIKDLAKNAASAFDAVINIVASCRAQGLDEIFQDNKLLFEDLRRLAKDHLDPMLGPLTHLPRPYAVALGVSPETSRIPVDSIGDFVETLIDISISRRYAWDKLLDALRAHEDKKELIDEIGRASTAIIQSGHGPVDQLAVFPTASTQALQKAILLFQVAPQEVVSSRAYLTLQYRNASAYLRESLSHEHNLITTTYQPGRDSRSYVYEDAWVKRWPLYRITHRLERLFYGSKDGDHGATIPNITFIPVSYFPGQIIGQIVLSTPVDIDVPSLIEFSQHFLGEIRTAATVEFVSLVQRSVSASRKFGERISHQDILRAVAKSLTAILSVQGLNALVRTRLSDNVWTYEDVHCERREGMVRPHDFIDLYLNPDSWKTSRVHRAVPTWTELNQSATQDNFEHFLSIGVEKCNAKRCRLKEEDSCKTDDPAPLNAFLQLEAPERISVVPNSSTIPRHIDVLPTLREMNGGIAEPQDTFLVIRLPFDEGEVSKDGREAILILLLWEPANAVRSMTFALLHTIWTGIRSCSELVRMADDAALASVALDVAHNVAAPITSFKRNFEKHVISDLSGFVDAKRNTLMQMGVALSVLEHFGNSMAQRATRSQRIESPSELGECDLYEVARMMTENEIVKEFWGSAEAIVRLGPAPSGLASIVVKGRLTDWGVILYILLKNAWEATRGLQRQEIFVSLDRDTTHHGLFQTVRITVCNRAERLPTDLIGEMERCLGGQQKVMKTDPVKRGNGVGLGLAGERLQRLGVAASVSQGDDNVVRITLSQESSV